MVSGKRINNDLLPKHGVKMPAELKEFPGHREELEKCLGQVGDQNIAYAKTGAVHEKENAIGMRLLKRRANG